MPELPVIALVRIIVLLVVVAIDLWVYADAKLLANGALCVVFRDRPIRFRLVRPPRRARLLERSSVHSHNTCPDRLVASLIAICHAQPPFVAQPLA
jgi:hypothetical protein